MAVFQIAAEADDGSVWRNWATSTSTSDTGGIGLSVICYSDGNITWDWNLIPGQASYKARIKNNVGTIIFTFSCGGVPPDTTGQTSNNEPVYGRSDGPFTLEVEFYASSLCAGPIIASGTASGWDVPDNSTIDTTNKLVIGDTTKGINTPFNGSAWARFLAVTVPPGSVILDATLRLQATYDQGIPPGPVELLITAEDSSFGFNPTSFDDYWSKPRVSGGTVETITTWDPSAFYEYDVTTIVQNVINRGDWFSGGTITIFLQDFDESHNGGIYILAQDYPSLNGPRLTIDYGLAGVGTADGTSTANATSLSGSRGDISCQSVVDGFGAFTLTVVATAAGSATVEGVGASTAEAVGTAAGTSNADGADARQGWESVGTSDGVANADGAPTEIEWVSVGTSDGTSTVTATGLSNTLGVGLSDGTSTSDGIGLSEAASVGLSAGVGSTPGVAESTAEVAGTSAGQANADNAEGLQGWDSVGSSDGVGTASGVGLSENTTVGTAAGSSTAFAEREVLVAVTGSIAAGASTFGGGGWLVFITGTSEGVAKVQGRVISNQLLWLQDLGERMGARSVGADSPRFLELNGAVIIEPTAFEPDAATHRQSHYYNATTNTLYRKVVTRNEPGVVVAHWQKVSD